MASSDNYTQSAVYMLRSLTVLCNDGESCTHLNLKYFGQRQLSDLICQGLIDVLLHLEHLHAASAKIHHQQKPSQAKYTTTFNMLIDFRELELECFFIM